MEFAQNGRCFSVSCKPGIRVIPATMAPTNNMTAYIIRVEVELRHDGHAEQHSENAVPVQQQAHYGEKKEGKRRGQICGV